MAIEEGVRTGRFGGWKERAETGKLFGCDGEADHLLDCSTWLGKVRQKGRRRDGLMTSTVPDGQARLSGSFLTTSAVLKMPWIEQALTLNW